MNEIVYDYSHNVVGENQNVALGLSNKLKRPAHLDELFIASHKKKIRKWVDHRAATTHEKYLNSLTQATQPDDNVDGSTKLQFWKDAAGGKTRGKCYRAAQLVGNVRYGVSYFTHVSITNHDREAESQAIEAVRAEASAVCEEAEEAIASAQETIADAEETIALAEEASALAKEAIACAVEAIAQKADLAKKIEDFRQQVFDMMQPRQAGPSTAPSNDHPDYDLSEEDDDE